MQSSVIGCAARREPSKPMSAYRDIRKDFHNQIISSKVPIESNNGIRFEF